MAAAGDCVQDMKSRERKCVMKNLALQPETTLTLSISVSVMAISAMAIVAGK